MRQKRSTSIKEIAHSAPGFYTDIGFGACGMDLDEVTQTVREAAQRDLKLNNTVKLDLGSDGVVVLDARSFPHRVSNENQPTGATIKVSLSNLSAISAGKMNPMLAFLGGKIKITGDRSMVNKVLAIAETLLVKR